MRYAIEHQTGYTYSRPVFLEPQAIRLVPRCDGAQRLERFDIDIYPAPAGQTRGLDAENNVVVWAWFSGLTDELRITTRATVETTRTNPFDYLLSEEASSLPVRYSPAEAASLAPWLRRADRVEGDDTVAALAQELAGAAGGRPDAFLAGLLRDLSDRLTIEVRDYGDAAPAAETLACGEGACRDASVLFIDACRVAGIAARFVSGYQEGDPSQERRDLHAWAEAYLPGAGWRGYDPTLGLTVADRHIAVAASADAAGAMPVTGSFRGTGAAAQLTFQLHLETLPAWQQQQQQQQG